MLSIYIFLQSPTLTLLNLTSGVLLTCKGCVMHLFTLTCVGDDNNSNICQVTSVVVVSAVMVVVERSHPDVSVLNYTRCVYNSTRL